MNSLPIGSTRARRGRRATITVVALFAAVAGAELALRIAEPFPVSPPLYPGDVVEHAELRDSTHLDPALGWRFRSNAVVDDPSPDFHVEYRCNDEGFRAVCERTGATRRAMFLGDSFTFGVGVAAEQTFVERFADAHPTVQPLNFGMAGYGVDQMWRTAVEHGPSSQPDLVVASFVDEDLTRSLTSYRYRHGWVRKPTYALLDGRLVERTAANSPSAVVRWIEQHLYLAEVYRRVARRVGLARGSGERFELNLRLFLELRELCRTWGCDLVVVHFPQRGAWRPMASFAEAFEREGVAFLDIGALEASDPLALYFRRDPHFNADGHAFVASALQQFCAQRGWFEGAAK